MQARTVKIMLNAPEAHECANGFVSVRKTGSFGNEADYVKAEAVNTLFKPPINHVIKVAAKIFVFPVEIHLLFCEKMKSPLLSFGIVIPRATGKD